MHGLVNSDKTKGPSLSASMLVSVPQRNLTSIIGSWHFLFSTYTKLLYQFSVTCQSAYSRIPQFCFSKSLTIITSSTFKFYVFLLLVQWYQINCIRRFPFHFSWFEFNYSCAQKTYITLHVMKFYNRWWLLRKLFTHWLQNVVHNVQHTNLAA